jgi:hypothetical protein
MRRLPRSLRVPVSLRLDDPRRRPRRIAALLSVVFLLGASTGLLRTDDAAERAAATIEVRLLPLLGELDALWVSGRDGRLPIAEALTVLRDDGAPPSPEDIAAWLATHDNLLLRAAGVDLSAEGRAVQRHVLTAITVSRDAVEVLGRAASFVPGPARTELLVQVVRMRLRSEQMTLTIIASVDDLRGERRRVVPPPALPSPTDLLR